MSVKLLTEHHLRFPSLKGGCTGSSESTLVKMPHCWKSRVTAHVSMVHKCVHNGQLKHTCSDLNHSTEHKSVELQILYRKDNKAQQKRSSIA